MDLSPELAQELKEAGLRWESELHDFFYVPDLEDRLFVISDVMATVEVLRGWPSITFNGAVEWALDYVWTEEAIWIPTETQLRHLLADALGKDGSFQLLYAQGTYRCELLLAESPLVFSAETGSDAYALALLALLRQEV